MRILLSIRAIFNSIILSATMASAEATSSAQSTAATIIVQPVALVIGAAFVSNEYSKRCADDSPYRRDRTRIESLIQVLNNYYVMTLSRDCTVKNCVENRHIEAAISARCVLKVASRLVEIGKAEGKIGMIIFDYVRFPSEYLYPAFKSFLESMLPELNRYKWLAPNACIFVSNQPAIREMISKSKALKMELVTNPTENPLYDATERVKLHIHSTINNTEQIAQYCDTNAPFLKLYVCE